MQDGPPGPLAGRAPAALLLTPAEVAAAFRVDPKTVTRWAKTGKLNSIRTLGGHRRYLEAEIRAILDIPADEYHAWVPHYGDQFHGH
jgi:excisionase family DNA binding protein